MCAGSMVEVHKGSEKWHDAQKDEMMFWLKPMETFALIIGDRDGVIRKYSAQRASEIFCIHGEPDLETISGKKCLEIGAGPIPFLISWNTAKKRVAVDPLFSFYELYTGLEPWKKHRGVWFYDCKGEDFRYKKPHDFDIIICANSLDHCDSPDLVRDVIIDNLADRGRVYLDVYLRKAGELKAHPHGWETPETFCNWFNASGKLKYIYIKVFRPEPPEHEHLFVRIEHA